MSTFDRKQTTFKYLSTSHICMTKYKKSMYLISCKNIFNLAFFFFKSTYFIGYNLVIEIFKINKNKYCIYILRLLVSVMS